MGNGKEQSDVEKLLIYAPCPMPHAQFSRQELIHFYPNFFESLIIYQENFHKKGKEIIKIYKAS